MLTERLFQVLAPHEQHHRLLRAPMLPAVLARRELHCNTAIRSGSHLGTLQLTNGHREVCLPDVVLG